MGGSAGQGSCSQAWAPGEHQPGNITIPLTGTPYYLNRFRPHRRLGGGTAQIVSPTPEKYDYGNIHYPATGVTTIGEDGLYLFIARASFTTHSIETGPFLLRVAPGVLNADNSLNESIE